MRALVVIDIQNDFCPGGKLPVSEGNTIIPLVNQLQDKFDCIVATQDWHPPNHSSFASHHGLSPGKVIKINNVDQTLWPDHCVQDTYGAEFVEGLHVEKFERVFQKGVDPQYDSYSGFFDNAHKRATGLGDFLTEKGIEAVYLAGLATDYCVKFSATDGVNLGFKVFVIEDACRGIDLNKGDIRKAISEMKANGVHIIRSKDVLESR